MPQPDLYEKGLLQMSRFNIWKGRVGICILFVMMFVCFVCWLCQHSIIMPTVANQSKDNVFWLAGKIFLYTITCFFILDMKSEWVCAMLLCTFIHSNTHIFKERPTSCQNKYFHHVLSSHVLIHACTLWCTESLKPTLTNTRGQNGAREVPLTQRMFLMVTHEETGHRVHEI